MGNGRFNFSPALTDSRNPAGSGGDSAASMLLGYPTLIGHDYTFPFPGIRVNEYGSYVADDWRMSRKLTLNYGLRWDYFSPPTEGQNQWSNFNPNTGKMDVAGRNGVSRTADVLPFRKDFGPRLGFAYQVYPSTVLRGGFGLFYNASGSEALNMRLARNIPFGLTSSVSPGDITPGTTVSQGFPALPTVNFALADNPTGSQSSISPSFRPSYAEQFNLGVEQEIFQAEYGAEDRLESVIWVVGYTTRTTSTRQSQAPRFSTHGVHSTASIQTSATSTMRFPTGSATIMRSSSSWTSG